jgi:hypothetical protein
MKYGLFAAIAFGIVALMSGMASAGVATSGIANQSAAPAASIVQDVGWKNKRCYRRCRAHGGSRHRCRRRCHKWWF